MPFRRLMAVARPRRCANPQPAGVARVRRNEPMTFSAVTELHHANIIPRGEACHVKAVVATSSLFPRRSRDVPKTPIHELNHLLR